MMTREMVLARLAKIIVSIDHTHPLRVAIDGIDVAGKTTLADELASLVEQQGRPIIRASIDGFHRPRQERYQRGQDSAEGYFEDSFDYKALRDVLLQPIGPHGSRRYQRAVFDFHTDTPLPMRLEEAAPNAILLFDGVFLQRPELYDLWDYRIFARVDFEVALQRAMVRDQVLFGSSEPVKARYLQRYIPGQRLYLQAVHPQERADVVLENNDLMYPRLVFPSQASN
jgi:uridine kinase